MINNKSLKICSIDRTPLVELYDNTPYRVRNINESLKINEIMSLSFDLPIDNPKWKYIRNEELVLFNDEYYKIKNPSFIHDEDNKLYVHVECKHYSDNLANDLISVEETTPRNVIDLMKIALCYDENGNPTKGWTVGEVTVDRVAMRGLEVMEQSPFSVLLTIAEKYDGILKFNSKTMKVDMLERQSTTRPTIDLRVSKNLKSVEINYDTSEMYTRLYCYGCTDDDGNELDIMSVNPTGKPYIDNFDYFYKLGYSQEFVIAHPELFVFTNIWRDDNYYDAQDLYNDGIRELEKVAQPVVTVSVSALDMEAVSNSGDMTKLALGDCIRVYDEDLGVDTLCNVVSRQIDHEQPHILNIEVTNSVVYHDTLSKLFTNVTTASSIVTSGGNLVGGNGTSMNDVKNYLNLYYLNTDQLEANYAKIATLEAEYLNAEQIKTNYLDATSIGATYATIGSLEAVEAQIKDLDVQTINAKLAEVEELVADTAEITKLIATEAEIEDLKAENVTVAGKLKATDAEIETVKATYAQIGSFEAYKGTVENLFATNAEIDSLKAKYIEALLIETDAAKITQLEATIANIEQLQASMATIESLVSQTIVTGDLEATNGTITNLNTTLANIETAIIDIAKVENLEAANAQIENLNTQYINAVKADVDELNAKSATISQLSAYTLKSEFGEFQNLTAENFKAANADIGVLDANVANINSVLAGNIGTGLLQTVHLTADNVVIDDAVIKSANIESIDTDIVTVGNDNIILSGSTQQFKDADGNVRVQIGQDAEGNFSFIVADEDGATVIDADGVTKNAIPNGLIVDQMVADDANIQASKIEYVATEGNTTLQTHLETEQGRINALIKETTIDNEDGTTTSLKDKYLDIDATVDGMKTTIGDVSTDMETMNSKITEIEATANGIFTKVSSIGGQNLFYYSAKEWTNKTNSEDYIFVGCYKEDTDNDMEGKYVTLSIEIQTDATTSGTFDICYYGVETPTESDINTLYENIPLTELANGKYIKTFVYPTTAPLIINEDGVMPVYTMVIRVSDITGTFAVRKGMLQYGQLATEWQPSSDNVSESVSIARQEAGKISWLVKSGTDVTNFELTPRTANLVADEINLNGLVTFSGLSQDAQDKINNAASNIEVGARNLLRDAYLDVYTTNANGSLDKTNYQIDGSLTYQREAVSNLGFYITRYDIMKTDTSYVVAFKARCIEGPITQIYVHGITPNNTASSSVIVDGVNIGSFNSTLPIDMSDGKWHNFILRFTTNSDIVADTYLGHILQWNKANQTAFTVEMTGLKWEKGTVPTDWTSAPTDNVEAWTADAIAEGVTTINGGYIKSQTINTEQLVVNDIFSTGSAVMNIINAQEIDAVRITSGTVKSNFIELYGMEVKQKNTGVTTLYIEDTGDITLRGSLESYNYESGKSGWAITKDGDAEFNDVVIRGDLINANGGIASDTTGSKPVRFWAGSTYEERENAPWIVYNDGSMLATQGTFGGVFTGDIEIGNISIVDPSKTAGNDAILTIQNGDNGVTAVQLRDTSQSDFAQNINITDNFYNTQIFLGQDGVGTFSTGVVVGDTSKSVRLDNDLININGSEINASDGTINVLSSNFKVGSVSTNNNLEVWGTTTLQKDVTILGDINIGNKWKVNINSNGIDIDFIR